MLKSKRIRLDKNNFFLIIFVCLCCPSQKTLSITSRETKGHMLLGFAWKSYLTDFVGYDRQAKCPTDSGVIDPFGWEAFVGW